MVTQGWYLHLVTDIYNINYKKKYIQKLLKSYKHKTHVCSLYVKIMSWGHTWLSYELFCHVKWSLFEGSAYMQGGEMVKKSLYVMVTLLLKNL
jgi:hypothetical protein